MSHLDRAVSIADLRRLAKARLPGPIFDFFEGGAEDERALTDNEAAFARVRLLPKVLVDVGTADTSTRLLGQKTPVPFAIAPMGGGGFGRPGTDIALARAAAAAGIPYALSTSATASIERVAAAASGRLWFQAYILRDKAHLAGLIERARVAGYEALMITVDLPVGGKRERDLRNGVSFPFRPGLRHVLPFAARPAWLLDLARAGMPEMENLAGAGSERTAAVGRGASAVGRGYDPGFDWDALKRLRDSWPRALIVKGVMRGDDAARLAGMGVDAIVVSNHGGRQLDAAPATLDALPAVVAAVAGGAPVWVDGGVRRGADIVRALALGADAVLVGRAALWGAFVGGEAGAERAIAILAEELVRTLQLCGTPRLSDLGRDLIAGG